MAEHLNEKIVDELISIADNEALSESDRDYAERLANHINGRGDEETRKIIYATFHPKFDWSAGSDDFRSVVNIGLALPEDSEISKAIKSTAKAPKYNTKVGEMFEQFGGDEVVDERSPKYWAYKNEIDDKVISEIAEANGMEKQDLYNLLQKESNKERNKNIALGTELGANFGDRLAAIGMNLVMPRTMEGVSEGKGFVPAAFASDITENAIYGLNPIGKAGQLGLRTFGKYAPKLATETAMSAGRAGVNVASAFGTPALMELTDNVVNSAIGEEDKKSAGEIAGSIVGEGVANLMADRRARRLLFGMSPTGERRGLSKALRESFGEASEKTAEKVAKKPYSSKDFISETEKALKEREKVEKRILEKKRGVKPSEQEILKSTSPIITGSGKEMDKHATEIAKMMAKQDLSLEEATAKYFERIRKKIGNDDAFQKYIDDFKFEIKTKPEASKNIKIVDGKYVVEGSAPNREFGYNVYVGDDGLVKPTEHLKEMIEKSSWGEVLTKKFEKPKRETPKKKSFIREQLKFGTIEPKSYATYKTSDILGEKTAIPFVGATFGKDEKERREKEKERREEEAARSRYVFNPYLEESVEEKPKRSGGIRAYLRGEAGIPTQEEVERAIARKLGIDMGE